MSDAAVDAPIRVALVTGAATGQGAEHVRRLAADGFRVVGTDVVAGPEQTSGGDFRALDVTDERHWATTVGEILAEYGRLDVLVNNAGVMGPSLPIEETSLSCWTDVVAVNQTGCFLGIRAVIAPMRRAASGSIINISSIAGMGGAPGRIPYQASKWAVRGLTRSAAVELAGSGVRVNAIVPGWVNTQMVVNAVRPAEEIAKDIPMRWIADPTDISACVSFLASDQSRYVTGIDLVVDGGIRARI